MQFPRTLRKGVFAVVLTMPALASAQWLNYPTAGVPEESRWLAQSFGTHAPHQRRQTGSLGFVAAQRNLPCPPEGCFDMQVSHEFFDIGWSMGGLPYQPWAADLRKSRMAENGKTNPWTNCRPNGIVKLAINPFFRKFIQLPGVLVILVERDTAYRQIFTDGRSLPVDPLPTPNGYSVGKWDGDTLVVETNGFSDGQWLDQNGSPLTDAAKITERYRRVNYGSMELAITVDDPKAYIKPWTVKVNELIQPNTELMDYFCLENERDVKHLVGK